jgi:plastocyanin
MFTLESMQKEFAMTLVHKSHIASPNLLSRREVLRLLGGAALASAGIVALGHRALAQDGGTPAAGPQVGPREDGSTLWRVKVAEMDMSEKLDFHAFFPEELTIAAGDAVWFDFGMGGFHTVSFMAGGEVPMLQIPDPEAGTPAAGDTPKMILNPLVAFQGGDSYDGSAYVNSGIDVFRDPTQPYILTFPTPGTYDYLCIVHASVMKARVVVQEAGAALPATQADYDQMTADKIAAFHEQAQAEKDQYAQATSTQNADGTTTWEVTAGAGGATQVRVQAFLPAELEIKVGDTVRWVHRAPGEPHTISFIGAGEATPEDVIVEQFADGSPKFVQSPLTFFPQGGDVWHGTGWVNSGFLGYIPGQPAEYSLSFDTPGDYTYFCVLHGDSEGNNMAAKLTVSPR